MSILPMAPGPMRDRITGTKSSQQEIDAWNQKMGGPQSYLGGSPTFDESGGQAPPPQQQAALGQAIQGQQQYTPISQQNAPQLRGALSKGGNFGSVAGNALSGAATGASLGSAVPGIGNAIGAGIGAAVGGIKGMFGKKAASAATDIGVNDARNAVGGAIQEFYGRAPNQGEIDQILGGQGLKPGGQWVGQQGLGSVLQSIQQNGQQMAKAAPAAAPEAAAVAQAVAGPAAGGKGGILEGFSADKMGMGMEKQMKSPKYAFAAVAQKYDQSDPAQRQAMMAELKNHPSGFFKNAQLTGSKGDILDVGDQTDPVWGGIRQFDVIRAAGEGGKAWQWGERGGDSGGASGGGGAYPNASGYNASGDPVLAAINGQSLNPVVNGMDMLRKLLGEIPGGLNGLAGGNG